MIPRAQLLSFLVLAASTAGLWQAVIHLWSTPLAPPRPPTVGGELQLELPQFLGSELPGPLELALSEFLERPLFSPGRRPPVPAPQPVADPVPTSQIVTFVQEEAEPAAQAQSDWQELRLIGVLKGDGKSQILVTTPEDPEGTWFGEGEEVFGWRIDAIASNKAEVVFGEERHTLDLHIGE